MAKLKKEAARPARSRAAKKAADKAVSKSATKAPGKPANATRAATKASAKPSSKVVSSRSTVKVAPKPAAKTKTKPSGVPAPFVGFPKDFLAFFRELPKNNNREWFAENKERYTRSILEPSLSFISAMDLPLGRFADCFEAKARTQGGSMFRIYNDMRFGHDPKPYKEHAAFQFRHSAGKDAHAPGFYVHIEPKQVFFGGGLWRPPGPQLRQIREAIADDPERWVEVTRNAGFRKRFGQVRGDALKRPPQGFDPDHPFVEELKRISFFAMQEVKSEDILSKRFVTDVSKAFEALSPFMRFLTEAVGLPFHLDD